MRNVVICGAGIAGVSAAYHLSVRRGVRNVTLVDERAPLSLTSDKSTECYRNWWPGPGDAMVRLMNRSIDLLEELARESGNRLQMNRRGYLYVTGDASRIADLRAAGEEAAMLGAGELRCHPGGEAYRPAPAHGFEDQPRGADLLTDPDLIHRYFPYLTPDTAAVLHARRCGYLSAQQYGMYMLEQARALGVSFRNARVTGIETAGGRVRGVQFADGTTLGADAVVNAGGPFVKLLARMIGVELPVFSELHSKAILRDDAGAAPRDTPLLIWIDRQHLNWSRAERELFAEAEETRWLLDELPAGVHGRSEGGTGSPYFLIQWTLHTDPVEPEFPPHIDGQFAELALRGLSRMLPGLRVYYERLPKAVLDGGYYTKTRENRPLIGPLGVEGAYLIGALGGFGIMASSAAGELLASYITGEELPGYAPAFRLERYQDAAYKELLANWSSTSGQI